MLFNILNNWLQIWHDFLTNIFQIVIISQSYQEIMHVPTLFW